MIQVMMFEVEVGAIVPGGLTQGSSLHWNIVAEVWKQFAARERLFVAMHGAGPGLLAMSSMLPIWLRT
jgi:hypothetical protein